ncbi:hypothetical protein Tco_1578022 [Tanacetum coccineum]
MRSIISTISISLEGFLPSILLQVVIIVTVVIVVTVILVVVVAIIGVVIVITIIGVVVVVMIIGVVGVVFEALKRLGYLVGLLYSNRFGLVIPPGQGILGESTSSKFHFAVLGTVATRKYRFSSFKPTNETNSSFSTIEVEMLATHKLFVVKSFWEERNIGKSNIGDSDNTGDGGKIVGGAIGAYGNSLSVASYACMTDVFQNL